MSFLFKSFCLQNDTIPYYTHIEFGPSQKPQKYIIPSVALPRGVALPGLGLYTN
jgi:hypothetical protein